MIRERLAFERLKKKAFQLAFLNVFVPHIPVVVRVFQQANFGPIRVYKRVVKAEGAPDFS